MDNVRIDETKNKNMDAHSREIQTTASRYRRRTNLDFKTQHALERLKRLERLKIPKQ